MQSTHPDSGLIKQHCAECGVLMIQNDNGSYNQCCNGAGYWLNKQPHKDDRMYPIITHRGFYLYFNIKKVVFIRVNKSKKLLSANL